MGELRLAWRNVWRSPRRTGLTVAATVFAVFLVVCFVAMSRGVHQKMIEDTVRMNSGHVTLSADGYFENRTLDYFVVLDQSLVRKLDAAPEVHSWAPRVVSFGLLSQDVTSQGVGLLGVDPEREAAVTTLASRITEGRFLTSEGRREIVLGERLAERLGSSLGDALLVYGVAYSLETAYELFTLVGTVRLPDAGLERSLALITLRDAQDFLVFGERVSEIAVLAASADETNSLRDALRVRFESPREGEPAIAVRTWPEVMPELDQLLFLDDAGMYIMLAILVVVVGFGILNTVLMAVLERARELGVMLAVGLRPAAVFRIVFLESLFLASVGLAIGLALAIPTCLWFQANPIDLSGEMAGATEYFGIEPQIVFELDAENLVFSSLAILCVALLAALYPALKASRSDPVEALRSI